MISFNEIDLFTAMSMNSLKDLFRSSQISCLCMYDLLTWNGVLFFFTPMDYDFPSQSWIVIFKS